MQVLFLRRMTNKRDLAAFPARLSYRANCLRLMLKEVFYAFLQVLSMQTYNVFTKKRLNNKIHTPFNSANILIVS